MANLLPRSKAPFPALTEAERARVQTRARFLLAGASAPVRSDADALARSLAGELDELEDAPSLPLAQALLAEIDERTGRIPSRSGPPEGMLRSLLYRPGRSLRSGEAEAASRGFFDVADRPPPILWLEAVARSRAPGSDDLEVGILCGVPQAASVAAAEGVRACASGALIWLDEADADFASALPSRIDGGA